MRGTGAEQPRSRDEGPRNGTGPKGLTVSYCGRRPTGDGRSRMTKAKPFDIPKREVWEAFKKVKANQGGGWGRRTVDRGVRGQPSWQPLQALEPAVLGELLPSTGATGGHPQGKWRDASVGHSNGGRSCSTRGCPPVSGAVFGICFPRRLIRLSARPLGDRCSAHSAPAVLAV